MSKLQPVRGTHDILPGEARQRRFIIETMREVAERYGFGEIATPIFEFSDVFHRTLGDTSDVVTKETYTFDDRGGELLTLRPEFTAPVVRAFLSNGLQQNLPCKFYYHGPAFRYERPQKGRLRQFHQFGVELLGVAEPQADVEMIAMAWQALGALGLVDKLRLEINTLGDAESRNAYRAALVEYFTQHKDRLSEDSRIRLGKNPLRILDSKDAGDREVIAGAPMASDYRSEAAAAFFARVEQGLADLQIPAQLNEQLVRGLDYYNHTVFEFIADDGLGAQNTVLAGGRYDGLVKLMGGVDTPGIGWAAGIERLMALLDGANTVPVPELSAIIPIGEKAEASVWQLAAELRVAGVAVDMSYKGNVGKRMKQADKVGATWAVILGEEELLTGTVKLKNMKTGEERVILRSHLTKELQR